MAPLHHTVTSTSKNLQRNKSPETSFTQALANATLLHYPKNNAPAAVTVDASDVAVLEQFTDGAWHCWRILAVYCVKLKSNIVLSTVNCLLFTFPFVIFVIFWTVDVL